MIVISESVGKEKNKIKCGRSGKTMVHKIVGKKNSNKTEFNKRSKYVALCLSQAVLRKDKEKLR